MTQKKELYRKAFHVLIGSILGLAFHHNIIGKVQFVVLVGILIILFIAYAFYKIPVLHNIMMQLEREHVLRRFPGKGATLFVIGMTLSVYLFPKDIATAAIFVVTWSDGIAGLVGPHGKYKYVNPKKTWEGLIFGMIAGIIAASFFAPILGVVIGTVIAMLIEGLDLAIKDWRIDDNVTIPLIAGTIMFITQTLF